MAEELIPITLFLCVTAVLLLRPITKRLGLLLELMIKDRQIPQSSHLEDPALARITSLLERLDNRIDLMETRLEFMERLADRPAERSRLTSRV